MTMRLLLLYITLFFILKDFVECRGHNHHHHHHYNHRYKKPHPCPVPGGTNGFCTPPHLCEEKAYHSRRRDEHFCRIRNRFDRPMVCCLNKKEEIVTIPETPEIEIVPEKNYDQLIEKKCSEYTKIAVEVDNKKETDSSPKFMNTFVVGGVASLAKEFPHMVTNSLINCRVEIRKGALLGFGSEDNIEWKCGGSLISGKFVLTAAHCLYTPSLGDVNFVRLGDLNIASDTDDAQPQQFKIVNRYSHPDYVSGESQYNDIALIELENSVDFTKHVRPCCLETSEESAYELIATGWGTTEFGGPTSQILQKVDLIFYDYARCNLTFGPQRLLERGIEEESQICAGGAENQEKDTCQGDSGGPLQKKMFDAPKMYKVVGVTSFGKACGLANTPGVYSKVSYFTPWIADVVWAN